MKTLLKPLSDIRPEEIFQECVKGYTNEQKCEAILKCKDLVCVDSKAYDQCIPHHVNELSLSKLPKGVSTEDLISVYTQKFAEQNGPGRKYYNAIKGQVKRGVCPICGIRPVNTLDHYIPKSKAPTLSVTPNNLIPSCRDCNFDKCADFNDDPLDIPVHLYYDNIPDEPWLFVQLKENLEAIYYISCPDSWEQGLRSRLEKHLDFYKLHVLYSSHAAQEIADKTAMWKALVNCGGITQLQFIIETECESAEVNDINSWKSALYRGLKMDFNKVKKYLIS